MPPTGYCADCGKGSWGVRCASCAARERWRNPDDPRRTTRNRALKPGDASWPTCKCGCGGAVSARSGWDAKTGAAPGSPRDYADGHGSRTVRDRWRGAKRACSMCGEYLDPARFSKGRCVDGLRSACKDCTAIQSTKYYEANRERYAENGRRYWDSVPVDVRRALSRRWGHTRRARLLAAFVEIVDPRIVFERDEGACGICEEAVDPTSFHVDHVVPLARGGEHSYANVQLAHPKCNMQKSDRMEHSMARKKQDDGTETVELASGTKVTRATGQAPGPDVSNADIDLGAVSADAAFSTYHTNENSNPDNLRPPPGPSVIQVLGTPEKAGEEPVNPAEEAR